MTNQNLKLLFLRSDVVCLPIHKYWGEGSCAKNFYSWRLIVTDRPPCSMPWRDLWSQVCALLQRIFSYITYSHASGEWKWVTQPKWNFAAKITVAVPALVCVTIWISCVAFQKFLWVSWSSLCPWSLQNRYNLHSNLTLLVTVAQNVKFLEIWGFLHHMWMMQQNF